MSNDMLGRELQELCLGTGGKDRCPNISAEKNSLLASASLREAPLHFSVSSPFGTLTKSWGRPQCCHAHEPSDDGITSPEKLRDDLSVPVERHRRRDTDASGGEEMKLFPPAQVDAAKGGMRALRSVVDSMVELSCEYRSCGTAIVTEAEGACG